MSVILDSSQTSDYVLTDCTIISSTGIQQDISTLIVELNVYEDLFGNAMSGDIVVLDAIDLMTKLDMHGNEYINIAFKTPNLEEFQKVFRIYKISDIRFDNQASYEYTIHFCSEEFVLNQQKRISKSYKNAKTSDIVKDIMRNILKVDSKKFLDTNIEETTKIQNIIVPNMKPFEAINWVASFSISKNLSSAFIFFENGGGYNFKSLEQLYSGNIRKNVYVSPKNAKMTWDNGQNQLHNFTIDAMRYAQLFDTLEGLATGRFTSKLLKMDLLNQKFENTQFDIITNNIARMNKHPLINDSRNRFDEQLIDDTSYVRYFTTFQDDLVDKWMLQRAAQFAMLNSQRLEIQLPGDSGLKCGDMLYVDFPSIAETMGPDNIAKDQFKSGLYLITSVRHRIFQNKYVNILQICKDSCISIIPKFTTGTVYKLARNL